jgi:hypothetical protein
MNLERGFRRLTTVVSLGLVGLGALASLTNDGFITAHPFGWWGLVAVIAAIPWGIFFTLRWVAQGFMRREGRPTADEAPSPPPSTSWGRRLGGTLLVWTVVTLGTAVMLLLAVAWFKVVTMLVGVIPVPFWFLVLGMAALTTVARRLWLRETPPPDASPEPAPQGQSARLPVASP